MENMLAKVKANLIIEHSADDALLNRGIAAATAYAEGYQHLGQDYYAANDASPNTEQAIIMLASHLYESRDGSTGGFFADSVQASHQVWNTVNTLLRLDRLWGV